MINASQLTPNETYNLIEEMERYDSERLALKWQDDKGSRREVTYHELIQQANQYANVLTGLGLSKGDKVLVMVPRLVEAYVTYYACLKAGLVIIPSSEMLRADDIKYRAEHSGSRAIISYAPYAEEIDQMEPVPETLEHKLMIGGSKEGWKEIETMAAEESRSFNIVQTHRDDTAFLPYTSGTTGKPKAVVHSHGWAYAHLRVAADEWLDIHENDVVWATAGPGWQKWVWSPFLSVLGQGATGFAYNGRFDPETYLQLLQDEKVNVLCCTPTEYRLMAKIEGLEKYDLSAMHSAVSAGEPLNEEVIQVFREKFNLPVRDGYGQTESTLLIGTLKGVPEKIGSMGKPMIEQFIEIVNEDGNPAKAKEIGNIAVHRNLPSLFQGYYKEPERTSASYQGDYFLTGDRAMKDEDNYYWFQGRSDDIIISSGYTIGPFEVEDALTKHPSVKECAAVASPDDIRGNVVKAFVVPNGQVENEEDLTKELQKHVKEMTAPYKYPRRIEFVESLPKTSSAKIRRVELREQELAKANKNQ
jgi:acetyl-CoA synthetase